MSGLDGPAVIALYDALMSHAMSLKLFEAVTDHEPPNPPGGGLHCAIMLGPLEPIRSSGLAATSGRLEFQARIYSPRYSLSNSAIDRKILQAATTLMSAYSGDFDLLTGNVAAGLVRNIDLLGSYGTPLRGTPGWLVQDGAPFRVYEISLPLILNDVFGQVA